MKPPVLIAFGGPKSQTGTAFRKEAAKYKIRLPESAENFEALANRVQQEQILLVLPLWNSHAGEVTISFAVELLLDGKATLHKLWPKEIEFECVTRVKAGKPIRTIISVPVAVDQCSGFIKKCKAKFIDGASTGKAYERFKKESNIDAALCVPGTGTAPFRILKGDVSNDINFTTFAVLGHNDTSNWKRQFGKLQSFLKPSACSYAAVELSLFSFVSADDQTILLDELTANVRTSAEMPRIVFASLREPDRCGLIIESTSYRLPEAILSDDGNLSEIKIIPRIGGGPEKYAQRVSGFLNKRFSKVLKHSFVRHIGTKPCFFACPPLEILTHGYDAEVVEPVFRRYMAKWFQLIDGGQITCSPEEQKFFNKYRKAYYKNAEYFFKFTTI